MPILDLQRRLVERGRIRLGEKKKTSDGREYPSKLSKFRVTSKDAKVLEAVADVYGGTVRPWAGGDEQFEVYTETDAFEIAVVPGQCLNQYLEHWGQEHPKSHKGPNPVICLRRCDSQMCMTPNPNGKGWVESGCLCADEEERLCKPTTRLSVILTKVPTFGVWRIDSKGDNAARELAGAVELLEAMTIARGRPVPARLLVELVTQITRAGTFKFPKPVLDIDRTFEEISVLLAGGVQPLGLEAAAPAAIETPATFTPIPPAVQLPAGSVRDQVAGAREQREQARRSNAAEPIRSTGMKPRPVGDAGAEVIEHENVDDADSAVAPSADGEPAGFGSSPGSPSPSPGGEPARGGDTADHGDDHVPPEDLSEDATQVAASPPGASPSATARARRVAIVCRNVGIDDDKQRHAFLALVTDGRATSGKQLDDADFALVLETLEEVRTGRLAFVVSPIDGAARLDQVAATDDDESWWGKPQWVELAKAHGLTQAKCMRQVKAIAGELGVPVPPDLGEWADGRISDQLRAWIEAHEAAA